jgi:hypothetical protein
MQCTILALLCWEPFREPGESLPGMARRGYGEDGIYSGQWQQCHSTIGSCRPGIDRARGLSRNPLGGFAREYAMFTRTGEPQRWRCSPGSRAALPFSGCYVDVGQLQERAAAGGGGRRTMDQDVRWFPGARAGLTPR